MESAVGLTSTVSSEESFVVVDQPEPFSAPSSSPAPPQSQPTSFDLMSLAMTSLNHADEREEEEVKQQFQQQEEKSTEFAEDNYYFDQYEEEEAEEIDHEEYDDDDFSLRGLNLSGGAKSSSATSQNKPTRKEMKSMRTIANQRRRQLKVHQLPQQQQTNAINSLACPRIDLATFLSCETDVATEEEQTSAMALAAAAPSSISVSSSSSSTTTRTSAANLFPCQSLLTSKSKRIHMSDLVSLLLLRANEIDAGRMKIVHHVTECDGSPVKEAEHRAPHRKQANRASSRVYYYHTHRRIGERYATPFNFARTDGLYLQYALYRFFRSSIETALHRNPYHNTILRAVAPIGLWAKHRRSERKRWQDPDERFMILLLRTLNDWTSGQPKEMNLQLRFTGGYGVYDHGRSYEYGKLNYLLRNADTSRMKLSEEDEEDAIPPTDSITACATIHDETHYYTHYYPHSHCYFDTQRYPFLHIEFDRLEKINQKDLGTQQVKEELENVASISNGQGSTSGKSNERMGKQPIARSRMAQELYSDE